jgi:hypothetical protein
MAVQIRNQLSVPPLSLNYELSAPVILAGDRKIGQAKFFTVKSRECRPARQFIHLIRNPFSSLSTLRSSIGRPALKGCLQPAFCLQKEKRCLPQGPVGSSAVL